MDDDVTGKKVEFVTISAEKIPFGRNNFIEVARKKGNHGGWRKRVHLALKGLLPP